jgi:hypothetical protein
VRGLAAGMSVLAEREDLLVRIGEATENRDPGALREALLELPGDPINSDQCFHYVVVSLPVKLPIFERVCRWTGGRHAGEVLTGDGSVAVSSGRSVTLSRETIGVLEDIGVISCGLEARFHREWIGVLQQACEPDYGAG